MTKVETEVKHVIDNLIYTATSYDIDALDNIYHDQLHVFMVDINNNLNTANKETFKNIFRSKKEAGDPPMDTWAKYHHIGVKGNKAHVLLSRKNALSGFDQILFLSERIMAPAIYSIFKSFF